jgi:hypothetical protein
VEHAYAAIGRAVFFAQIFETALIPIFEIFKLIDQPAYRLKTDGCISNGAFKVPITNIIKALADKGQIAPELEKRLSAYAQDRHTLIHRWVRENGWPEDDDVAGYSSIVELANRVESEAKQLTKQFADYMVKYANPEWAEKNSETYKLRMRHLFSLVHFEEKID